MPQYFRSRKPSTISEFVGRYPRVLARIAAAGHLSSIEQAAVILRDATARNRIKRLIREAFRLSKSELPAGVDLIVLTRGERLRLSAVRQSLTALARTVARRLRIPSFSENSP